MSDTLVVQAEIAELARVWDWANMEGERLAVSQSTLFAIHLCLEEALSNILQYAFPDDRDGNRGDKIVRLGLRREEDAILLTVEDHGIAFDPLEFVELPAPATLAEASIGGRGIHLMKEFTRHMAYERRDGTNRLTLRFASA